MQGVLPQLKWAYTGYIQLFRQRLSPKSVKAYATMPISIMSSNFLGLLD